ncbi:MAG: lipopolysaccharide biosynthesis protein [Gammaproteobacteria bacterium]|nr:lipopolysaccharide biosynthesis protein [Gammaproteobacteria bacterium]
MNEPTQIGQEEDGRTLQDYLAALRRRKWYVILPAVVILLAAAYVAKTLPATYRSTGKILIEQQEIPTEWVPATVTSFADQRIQAISQRVLTTANLTRVIEKLDLYTERQREMTNEQLVELMRNSFNIEMIDATVRNPQTGRAGVATIAFSVSFDHRTPAGAQRVANELVSLYLEENAKRRTEAVAETSRFLESEAERLSAELSDMEARIAEFKEKNMGRLPEQQDLNLELLQRAEEALQETRRQIESMEERKTYLESALVQMRSQPAAAEAGDSDSSPTDLPSLRARYASMSANYSDEHPDMVRLRRSIEALEQSGAGGSAADIEARLRERRQELAELEERYAEGHPDVIRIRSEITALEQQLERASRGPAVNGAENPALVKTRADLKSIESEIEALKRQERKYAEKVENIEQRIADTPKAEQQYRQLTRDHENLQAKYQEIRAKQSSARVAESLEQDRKGERFTLIEPPQLPQEPIEPDRLKILMMGFAGAFVGGFGAAFLREELDSGVRSSRAVSAATHAPVLGVIPMIETLRDRRRARRIRWLIPVAAVVVSAAGLAMVHLYYRPLDLLWFQVMQKVTALL